MSPALSVVVPAYNEERRLGASLERICAYLGARGRSYEVLVVDDGSRDTTAECVRAWAYPGVRLIQLGHNQGKGAAVRTGVLASQGRRVLLCDADLSTPIEAVETLDRTLDAGADLALGSRAVASSQVLVHQPLYREWMGKVFNLLIRLLGVRGFHDTQCGFKLLGGEAARALFADMKIDRFAFDVELVWLACRRGYRVEEVGVPWVNSADSRVDPVVDSLAMLRDVLRIRWLHRGTPRGAVSAVGERRA